MSDIESRLAAIEDRNRRVELDKRWETSPVRRILIALVIYLFATGAFLISQTPKPYLAALIPALGSFVSTLGLRAARRLWEKNK